MIRSKRLVSRDLRAILVPGVIMTPLLTVGFCQARANDSTTTGDSAGTRIAWEHVLQSVPDSKTGPIAPLPDASARKPATVREVVDPESLGTPPVSDSWKSRMRGLEKPLGEIEFTNSTESEKTPSSEASKVLAAEAPIYVTPFARTLAAPNRYPIAAMHNPLYFEDIGLERYGHTFGCTQTAVSAARFLAQTAILPYQVIERPWCTVECDRLDGQNRSRTPSSQQVLSSCDGLGSAGSVHDVE